MVAPYAGRFDDGWEAWRERAFARQLAEGIVPPGTVLTPRPPWVPAWESLSTQERRVFARYMEVFAGLLTHTDHHLGRLFDALDQRGIAGNTMVMVLSDNGASAEGGRNGTLNEAAAWMGVPSDVADTADRLADIGGHDTYNHYPTELDRAAREAGIVQLSGIDLLVGQALDQIRLMTGRSCPPEPLLDAAYAALGGRG